MPQEILTDLTLLSAVGMAELVRRRKISPVELIEAHLSKIEKLNPRLRAFVQIDAARARLEARRAESSRGGAVLPLHGVPVSIKSSIPVAGMAFDVGTRLRDGVVGSRDAPLVERLRAAGAIVLGVTNTAELLMAWETDNPLHGRTNNPWDLTRTPGGSSGGEAAAIAAGCSAGGVGSDGGGSIRVPAHFSGICGLKPTPGRIPATGHYPDSLGPFAGLGVVGPMARTVADLKLLFEVLQGPDDGDPSAAPVTSRWPADSEIKDIRIGYFEDDGRTPVTRETRQAVQSAAKALQEAGFRVEPFRPDGLEQVRMLWWKFFGIMGWMLLGPMLRGHEDELGPVLREFNEWVAAERPLTGDETLEAWMQRDLLRMKLFQQMREYPILLCPVAAVPAFKHGERAWEIDGQVVRYLDAWSYCEWFNLVGNPAAVVPVGRSPEGLPIGVQIAGRPWEEELVLSIASEIEKGCGGWQAPPFD